MMSTAHTDTFVRDRLPPREQWPVLSFDRPELQYPSILNCASELLDRPAAVRGHAVAIHAFDGTWSYARLHDTVNRIARVLVEDLGLVPGNRVLLRSANSPMMLASWLAVVKAGGVVVATMPLLRARELKVIVDKAQITLALCSSALLDELDAVREPSCALKRIVTWDGELERLMRDKPGTFAAAPTSQDDPCLLAFTSGTTGQPKATVHFHRDILAIADSFALHILGPRSDDVFAATPPLAFTYGLGASLVFPFRVGASTAILEGGKPEQILEGMERFKVTRLFTAPTAYRALQPAMRPMPWLRSCVSAGEFLPSATSDAWHATTGIRIVDGIGATEMTHIFISAAAADVRAGSTGRAVPGYIACVLDEEHRPVQPGEIGRLAVRGPTGCRYLDDARQSTYVVNGWNLTGDAYRLDGDGYFWYEARTDDMIVSAGYNIAAPEVEAALIEHEAVAECAVVAAADEQRGQVVKAFVVLREPHRSNEELTLQLQAFVKKTVAPYKYPRLIEYVSELPRTATGKLQRFRLRDP